MKRYELVPFLAIGGLMTILAGHAGAATFTVTNTNDTGAGSLRDAIVQHNTTGGNNTIGFDSAAFAAPQTIQTNNPLQINVNGTLTIDGTGADLLTIRAPEAGGPALNSANGNNTINGITFQGTTTDSFSATLNNDADLILNGVVITGNTSNAEGNASGGGLINFGGNLTINGSAITNNVVNNNEFNSGGGIVNAGNTATMSVVDTTVAGNAVHGGGDEGGGGIQNAGGGLRLVNVTIAGNSVDQGGGGIFNSGTVRLANSLVATNTGGPGSDIAGPDYVSQGHNLVGTTTGATFTSNTGDLLGTSANVINPLLGPLGDNGGTTPTMALQEGSPAIDAADANNSDAAPPAPPTLIPSLTTDQRGVARPQGGGNDIGAFELVPNRIDFGELTRDTRKGTAFLEVEVFAAGELTLAGNGIKPVQRAAVGRRAHHKPVAGPGTYKLKVKATGNKKKKLKKKGKVKVKAKVTFAPTNGTPNTETKKIKLKRKR